MAVGSRLAAMTAVSRRARLALLNAAALASLTLVGCSAEFSIGDSTAGRASGEEIADEIRADYERQSGVELRSITCEDVERESGEEFDCSARNSRGVQLEIDGEVTDVEADGFDYEWQVVAAVAPGVLYERALRRQIEEQGVALAEVRCPVEIEMEVGAELTCTASDRNGASRQVAIRLTDLDGGFDYQVEGHGGEAGGHSEGEEPTSPAGTQS